MSGLVGGRLPSLAFTVCTVISVSEPRERGARYGSSPHGEAHVAGAASHVYTHAFKFYSMAMI